MRAASLATGTVHTLKLTHHRHTHAGSIDSLEPRHVTLQLFSTWAPATELRAADAAWAYHEPDRSKAPRSRFTEALLPHECGMRSEPFADRDELAELDQAVAVLICSLDNLFARGRWQVCPHRHAQSEAKLGRVERSVARRVKLGKDAACGSGLRCVCGDALGGETWETSRALELPTYYLLYLDPHGSRGD